MKFKKSVENTLITIDVLCLIFLAGLEDFDLCIEAIAIMGVVLLTFVIITTLLSKYGKCFK